MRALIFFFALMLGLNARAETTEAPIQEPAVLDIRPTIETTSQTINKAELLEQAKSAYESEQYADSFDKFQTVLLHDRSNIKATIGLGDSALSLGFSDEAYIVFSKLKDQPLSLEETLQVNAGYALAKVESGKSANVVRDLKAAINTASQDYRLWNALGRFYDQGELWGDSFEAYFTALTMGQGRAITLNNLGMSQMMQGNYPAAHESFAHASGLRPDIDLYDNNRRLTLALQNDYQIAVKGLTGDRAALIFNDAGYLAMTNGQINLARFLFEKAIKISPVYHAKAQANLDALNTL